MASEYESSLVADKAIMSNFSDDEFENDAPDYPPEEEESNGEEDQDDLTLWEAALLKRKISLGKGKAKPKYGAKASNGKTKGKPGRKAVWSDECTNDLVDVICSSDIYQKKLIFTNIKTAKNGEYYAKIIEELKRRCEQRNEEFTYDVAQTREKFKRCISHCKEAALTMKTASGIKRFQEDKGFGKWFNTLLPLVQSRVSCQPEQAIEPSSCTKRKATCQLEPAGSPFQSNEGEEANNDTNCENVSMSEDSENQNPVKSSLFVPARRKKKPCFNNDEAIYALMEKVTSALEKDPTADLIKHFERENELARQHEIALFSMIFGQQPPNTSQVTQKVNQGQANNTYPLKVSNSQSHQPRANSMEQQHLNQTVLCSDSQLPRSQANTRQQHSNPASMTTNWLQQGSFIHQHPNPTSVPMNQFHQSQASVSTQQHSYPASMPTNQLQQSTASTVQQQHSNQIHTPCDQTTTGHA